jgi:hypothetical protein
VMTDGLRHSCAWCLEFVALEATIVIGVRGFGTIWNIRDY